MPGLYARLNRHFGERPTELSRRELLRASAAAGAALLLHGCASAPRTRKGPSQTKVVVVGAGLAGLCAAYQLTQAGLEVKIVEARDRIGGRVLTLRDFVPRKTVEGGGELIGANHPCWLAFAKQFGLELMDVGKDDTTFDPIVIDGRKLEYPEAAALWNSMNTALNEMNVLARDINADRPWQSARARDLDSRNIADWINALGADPLTKRACWINQASDNGQDPARMSLLGQLATVKGGGLEKFWTETESLRCRGGNDLLARRLADQTGRSRLQLGVPVSSIDTSGKGSVPCRVMLADGSLLECDHVILAVPPSVWSNIAFKPNLPAELAPQTGVNTKYLAHVQRRFWKDANLSQYALSDKPVEQTWDGTDGQDEGSSACLVGFSGGPGAEQVLEWPQDQQQHNFSDVLSRFYPGYDANFVNARLMDWPRDPWTACGYSFPAPGQVTTVGPMLAAGIGPLHFAGEHCCYKFVGYMEGALQSGIAAARRIHQPQGNLSDDVRWRKL